GVPVFEVPGSGQFVTTIRNSGFPILPDYEETPNHGIPGRVRNLMEVCGVDTFCNCATSTTTDEQLSFSVSINDSGDGPIMEWDMDLSAVLFNTTYLGRCSRWFSQHRGSIRLTFMFCGSAMTTGKLLLAYTPPGGAAPATRKEAMLGTHVVWDIGLQSSITMVVPWVSQTVYRYNHPKEENVLTYRGFLSVFHQTALVIPASVPHSAEICVLCSATSDFVMRCPTDSAYYQ
nr:VP3 [Bat picornavirus 2]